MCAVPVGPYDTTDYRRFLVEALRERGLQQKELAAAVGASPSLVSLVLSGLRGLDPELVEPVAAFLGLDAEATTYLAALVDIESKSPRSRRNAWATVRATQRHRAEAGLSEGLLTAMRRWYFAPVVELARCDGFRPDPAWVAGTLVPPVTVAQAEEAITTAVTIGLLVPDDDGVLRPAKTVDWSPSGVSMREGAPEAVAAHRVSMELAAGSLERSRHNERHVSTTVMAIGEEQFARLRARLRELEEELVLLASEAVEPANRVYQLGIQLFPVTLFSDSTADHSMFATSQGPPPDIEPDTTE